jgi:hypothetical protein
MRTKTGSDAKNAFVSIGKNGNLEKSNIDSHPKADPSVPNRDIIPPPAVTTVDA